MATTVTKPALATRKPSGVTIERNGLDFTFGWLIMSQDHGAGNECKFRTNVLAKDKWIGTNITTSTTSTTVSLNPASYYPNTSKILSSVTVAVRGKRSSTSSTSGGTTTVQPFDWSAWEYKTMAIYPARIPSVTTAPGDTYPKTTFSWNVETEDDDNRPFTKVEWQHMRVKESSVTDGSKLYWGSTTSNDFHSGTDADASDGLTIQEESDDLAKASWTRWFRVRALGPGGASSWRYAKHVYGKPYAGVIDKSNKKTVATHATGLSTNVRVEWTAYSVPAHPIDYTVVEYLIDTPASGLLPPSGDGVNWTEGATIADSKDADAATFVIPARVGLDQCLWVRVATVHDVHTTYSQVALLECGDLTDPEFNSTAITTNTSTNQATIPLPTHNSDVPDSKIAVWFHNGDYKPYICTVFTRNDSAAKTITLTYFNDASKIKFGLMEFQGTYSAKQMSYTIGSTTYTYYRYSIDANMESDEVLGDGDVPVAPTYVTAKYQPGAGKSSSKDTEKTAEVLVDWYWNWSGATGAEISWSDKEHAWESTEPPNTYQVDRIQASQIYVTNLERGKRWYFRVRFLRTTDATTVYGPYCKAVSVLLAEAPATPTTSSAEPAVTLEPEAEAGVSAGLVRQNSLVKVSWAYINSDGTRQRSAEVREVTLGWDSDQGVQTVTPVRTIAQVNSGVHHVYFRPENVPKPTLTPTWTNGTTHYLQVRVTSTAGLQSEWSSPIEISVARKLQASIYSTSLETVTISGKDRLRLTELPLSVHVTGATVGETVKVVVTRWRDYTVGRPDETEFHGCAGEVIASASRMGYGTVSIGLDDLVGAFDDYAWYRIAATVEDDFGQRSTVYKAFQVHWNHQPVKPTGSVTVSNGEALITPALPSGVTAEEGDTFDIYRLSADPPELIVRGGEFGETYRDPYPAIGELGGHRIVYRSKYGDYITAESKVAWTDLQKEDGDFFDSQSTIIEFGKYRLELEYNLELRSSWSKDFKKTTYLGGAVQGDWNPAVSRSGSIGTVSLSLDNTEQIRNMRRLAEYTGICHVRTPDGSSYAADIQVQEDQSYRNSLADFNLSVTRVDPQELDGEKVVS